MSKLTDYITANLWRSHEGYGSAWLVDPTLEQLLKIKRLAEGEISLKVFPHSNPLNNPYEVGTLDHAIWSDGYDLAEEEVGRIIGNERVFYRKRVTS